MGVTFDPVFFNELWCCHLPHMWISKSPGASHCDNGQSFVFSVSFNHQSPAILLLLPKNTYLWGLVFLCAHLRLIMSTFLTLELDSRCAALQAESHPLLSSQSSCSLRNKVFIWAETQINCSNGFDSDHTVTFIFNESINLLNALFVFTLHLDRITPELPNTKSAFFDRWTNKSLNVLIRQPQTALCLEKKKRRLTIILLIMWGRQGSAGVAVSFKKLYLLSPSHSAWTSE